MSNNDEFWFRRRKGIFTKDLGWGYLPINWKGSLSIFIWMLFVVLFAIRFNVFQKVPLKSDIIRFVSSVFLWIALFVWFCEKKTDRKYRKN